MDVNEGSDPDYTSHHPTEHPSDWGWHGEWGRASRIAGGVVVVILLLMFTTTHYNGQGFLLMGGTALLLLAILIADGARRKSPWRE